MFEGDLTSLSTADLLESAADHRAAANRLDARLLEHAQLYADRFHPDNCPVRPGRKSTGGRERAIVLGGDGCPEIAEFAPAEFAVVVGVSTGVATRLIGEALALRHRFPFTWAKVQAGEATPWKARQIAAACLKLSAEAARSVDKRVAGIVDTLTPYRLDKIVTAARFHADAAAARAEAEQKARERGVFVARGNDHGTTTIYIRTSTGNAKRYDATIAGIAEALKVFGDTRSLNARRAEAVGIIADPRYTEELLLQAQHHHRTHPTHAEDKGQAEPGAAASGDAPVTLPEKGLSAAASTPTPASTSSAPPATNSATPGDSPAEPGAAASGDDPTTTPEDVPSATASTPAPPATNPTAPNQSPAKPGAAASGDDPIRAPEDGPFAAASTPVPPATNTGCGVSAGSSGEDLLADWGSLWCEPGPFDEADRDAPHPSQTDLPDPLDAPCLILEPWDDPGGGPTDDTGEPMDPAAWRALHARLAQIKHDAHTTPRTPRAAGHRPGGPGATDRSPMPADGTPMPSGGTPMSSDGTAVSSSAQGVGGRAGGGRLQPGKTEIYIHLTDHTLATGTGVLRVEGLGPHLASQLAELVGHGPYVVKPVIDLNEPASVDAYEIPDRIRERVKLIHPAEQFPYGTAETTNTTDLDHIQPYDPLGPTEQTGTTNLVPLTRYHHRLKTHGRWKVRRLDPKTLEWTTPHGFVFHVDPTGTHRIPRPQRTPDPT
ncbi:uncharacterized protein DUF222 [Kribbella antiqua]|uniref:Uncharacterized protein DUF222 n=1 Tax=Kribbella antiqua TaxID=2512217 RepID=A0A4R2J1A4_9ACTN|nr:DUF222 domain-containing protein [Kribbella antiqua]TCO50576.1 uncharacterized protein DUF222 [Kribbella antiqua]